MANLPNETITTVFNLQHRLWELINEITAVEWTTLEQYGETRATMPPLAQLQNSRERLLSEC